MSSAYDSVMSEVDEKRKKYPLATKNMWDETVCDTSFQVLEFKELELSSKPNFEDFIGKLCKISYVQSGQTRRQSVVAVVLRVNDDTQMLIYRRLGKITEQYVRFDTVVSIQMTWNSVEVL